MYLFRKNWYAKGKNMQMEIYVSTKFIIIAIIIVTFIVMIVSYMF